MGTSTENWFRVLNVTQNCSSVSFTTVSTFVLTKGGAETKFVYGDILRDSDGTWGDKRAIGTCQW